MCQETGTQEGTLYPSPSFISVSSMSHVNIVLRIAFPYILHISYQRATLYPSMNLVCFRDFHRMPSVNSSIVCSPVLPLETLPGQSRRLVQIKYAPVLGIFTRYQKDSRKLPLHVVSTLPTKCPLSQAIWPHTLSAILSQHDPAVKVLIPLPTESTSKNYSISLSSRSLFCT